MVLLRLHNSLMLMTLVIITKCSIDAKVVDLDVALSACTSVPCNLTIRANFSLTDSTFFNVAIYNVSAKREFLFEGRDFMDNVYRVRKEDIVLNSSLLLSEVGSGIYSSLVVVILIPCAGKFDYNMRIEGRIPQPVWADHTGSVIAPSGGPHISIFFTNKDSDYVIVNGTVVTRSVSAVYDNAWRKPDSLNMTITGPGVQMSSSPPVHKIHPEDCTWHGMMASNVTFSEAGRVDIVHIVVMANETYRGVKSVQVIDIADCLCSKHNEAQPLWIAMRIVGFCTIILLLGLWCFCLLRRRNRNRKRNCNTRDSLGDKEKNKQRNSLEEVSLQ